MFQQITGYGWNSGASRYIDMTTGRFVSQTLVRGGLEDMIDASAANMNLLSQSLLDGNISLANWQSAMMEQIKATHTASAALSQGGWAQMTQSDWGAVGQLIREQYDYLRNFAAQIASGEQPLDGRVLVRADMYGDASNGTFWEMDKRSHIQDGYNEGRRILESGADHCDDCIAYAADGWMPIDEIPPIGDSQCVTRCRCEIEYRRSGMLFALDYKEDTDILFSPRDIP